MCQIPLHRPPPRFCGANPVAVVDLETLTPVESIFPPHLNALSAAVVSYRIIAMIIITCFLRFYNFLWLVLINDCR
jgi:hypothetical protein